MLKQHERLVDAGLRFLDLFLVVVALPLAHLIRHHLLPERHLAWSANLYALLLCAALLAWIAASSVSGLYDVYRTSGILTELGRVGRSTVVAGLIVTSAAWLLRDMELARGVLLAFFGLIFLLVTSSRLVVRHAARAARRRGFNSRCFAVVGSGPSADELVKRLLDRPEWGYHFTGFVLEDDAPAAPCDFPVLGRVRELGTILEEHVVDEMFFALPHHRLDRVDAAVAICDELGVAVRISLSSFGEQVTPMALADFGGHLMLAFSRAPSNELALAAKRVFDVVVSGVMLLLVAPVFAAVALVIKLDSAGPVFFRQRRVGLNGREFMLFKFRSMRVGAEAELARLRAQNEMDGPVFKMRQDPRVTRIGQFLRRTSIDELPQFWNVLVGHMSIVGPRPPLPDEVRQYKRWQRRRLSVKPGITCTWQVSGRNEIDFDRWMRLDLEYIDHWSLWRDVQICFQTVPAVLLARGAR
jgi:exopolysaccharide biosynthesis polyprenyl glycosylphosphotransferase